MMSPHTMLAGCPPHLQTHLSEIYARFPEHRADIDRYLVEAKAAVNSIPMFVLSRLLPWWLQKLLAPVLLRTFRR